jgi:hypothetical protein
VSHNLKEMNEEFDRQVDVKQAELMSQVGANSYHGLKKARKLAKKKRDTHSLPKFIRDNKFGVQFGIGTLPSDDMNMIMTNEFGLEFERRINERKEIESELVKLAAYCQKNQKFNIYKTKAQAMRDEVTKHILERQQQMNQEDQYFQSIAQPRLISKKNQGLPQLHTPRSQSLKQRPKLVNQALSQSSALPDLKTAEIDENEFEIKKLIRKNLEFEKPKKGEVKAAMIKTDKPERH